jgi:hypothetical protein
LECGVPSSEERIAAVIDEIVLSSENGLWNWGPVRHPVWATYDALKALTESVLRRQLLQTQH